MDPLYFSETTGSGVPSLIKNKYFGKAPIAENTHD